MTVAGRAGVAWWFRRSDHGQEVDMTTIDTSTDTDEIVEYLRHLSTLPHSTMRTIRADEALEELFNRGIHA